ncbi:hypothetical protein SAMN02990966_06868 [Rhodospirillales bacterium URHD0017]|nr:hypothetical protein SAMN02990966_06868 [Rhodospirillales bacterium URHD0017]
MPVFPISLACPFALNQVETIMLWPDDDVTRKALLDIAAADFIERTAREDADIRNLPLGPDGAKMIGWLARMPAREQFEERSKLRFAEGLVVGSMIVDALLEARGVGAVDFAATKERAMDSLQRTGLKGATNLSIKVLDNRILKTLRPVAHLWAAYIVQKATTKRDPLGDRSELGPLLDAAEKFLAEAAGVRLGTKKNRYRLLRPAEAWRLQTASTG